MTTQVKFVIFGISLLVIATIALTAKQSDLFRLRVALQASLVNIDGTLDERYQVKYLLDNSSCILMILDKGKDSISIAQVNKASCNHLVTK